MSKEGPTWEGLLKWSLSHTDGTQPSKTLSEEDRKWFMEAVQAQTVDVVQRMKEIKLLMDIPEESLGDCNLSPKDIEDVLDELQEHVESIDMANDLYNIGGLGPLLRYLGSSNANIKAKAAEVVSTIVQNNPKSQNLVIEAKGLKLLMDNFKNDSEDDAVRIKALGAISSLIRHNREGSALFRLGGGYSALKDALSSKNVRFQRKALNLIHYLLNEIPSDSGTVTNIGFRRSLMHLALSVDPEVREAALRCLVELARYRGGDGTKGILTKEEVVELNRVVVERIEGIIKMPPSELEVVKEERQLLDSLWNMFNEDQSPIRKNDLLVLPGEDDPAPDVASQHFQPPLRASKDASVKVDDSEKNELPLLLGLGPSANNASLGAPSTNNGSLGGPSTSNAA